MATWNLKTPLSKEDITKLKAGDLVTLSGIIYSCRDAAHKRFIQALDEGKELPIDIEGQIIYYMGPSPAPEGKVIGACGPTTSSRMDKFAPRLYSLGLAGSMGKGKRSQEVIDAMKEHKGVYFLATGGAGALASKSVKSVEVVAYDELGPEAVRRIEIENMPVLVVNDSYGEELYAKPKLDEAMA